MNMVSIKNVVSAINFFIDSGNHHHGDIYIISDDDSLNNNYRYIEKCFMEMLGYKDYKLPVFPLPQVITRLLLRLKGKSNLNPNCIYDSQKIMNAGFKKPAIFEEEIINYAEFYKKNICADYT